MKTIEHEINRIGVELECHGYESEGIYYINDGINRAYYNDKALLSALVKIPTNATWAEFVEGVSHVFGVEP